MDIDTDRDTDTDINTIDGVKKERETKIRSFKVIFKDHNNNVKILGRFCGITPKQVAQKH
jgi:hypothetical protein